MRHGARYDAAWEEANIEAGMEAMAEAQIHDWQREQELERLGQGPKYWDGEWEKSLEHERILIEGCLLWPRRMVVTWS